MDKHIFHIYLIAAALLIAVVNADAYRGGGSWNRSGNNFRNNNFSSPYRQMNRNQFNNVNITNIHVNIINNNRPFINNGSPIYQSRTWRNGWNNGWNSGWNNGRNNGWNNSWNNNWNNGNNYRYIRSNTNGFQPGNRSLWTPWNTFNLHFWRNNNWTY